MLSFQFGAYRPKKQASKQASEQQSGFSLRGHAYSLFFLLTLASLGGCVTPAQPKQQALCQRQLDSKPQDCHYYDDMVPYSRRYSEQAEQSSPNQDTRGDLVAAGGEPQFYSLDSLSAPKLSAGDRLKIQILNGEEFSGDVEVNADGYIYLPYLNAIRAEGVAIPELKQALSDELIKEQLMLAGTVRISIMPLQWGAINIRVSGAVYEPGQHKINRHSEVDIAEQHANFHGDNAQGRSLTKALRSSGGVRPDADIRQVVLTRQGKQYRLDLSGILSGKEVDNLILMSGDHIYVPETHYFDDSLARPSQITIPGIRVFISNLTQPASSNSQSAVDTEATRFPYGTRLLSGAIAANCMGGAQSTNASRHVILITKNPMSEQIDVVERSLSSLISHSYQPEINPVLLPGDGLACYDSRVTNLREVARTLTDLLVPVSLLGLL
ncbi:polysaccharide biosynthesis/export family protein [Shewanella sp. KCT]|uniref:polysaccharide biosynthesis/export family protein n=1 Tax=Shewanella sp. KCT TaxID=2569535 RepID=UPI0011825751|nr:polysaccharide biosynthesis/export family protein [Shewanella sp. KCT]